MKDLALKVGRLIAGDLTAEEKRVLLNVFFKIGWRVGGLAFALYSFGFLAFAGMGDGFAKGTDLDKKISEVSMRLTAEQTKQGALLTTISKQLTEANARSIASDIRVLTGKRCLLHGEQPEKEHLNSELDRKQEEYRALKGYEYTPPDCSAL